MISACGHVQSVVRSHAQRGYRGRRGARKPTILSDEEHAERYRKEQERREREMELYASKYTTSQLAIYGRGKLKPGQQKEHDKLAFQRNQKLRDQILELENTKSTGSPSWRRKKAELEKKEMQMLAKRSTESKQRYKEKEERRRSPKSLGAATTDREDSHRKRQSHGANDQLSTVAAQRRGKNFKVRILS